MLKELGVTNDGLLLVVLTSWFVLGSADGVWLSMPGPALMLRWTCDIGIQSGV